LHDAGGIEGLLLINEGGSTFRVGYDGIGNVATLVRASDGIVAASYEYAPFGETIKAVGADTVHNPFKFSTKYTDPETGLSYYGYRYYSPQSGRWTTRDPIAEEGGINLYAYVANAPVGSIDPDGRQQRRDRNWQRGERDPRTGRRYGDSGDYDINTPNWALATGPMHYSKHRVRLCIPRMRTNEAMNKIYDDFRRFNHFGSPVPNVVTFTRSGNRGHFAVSGGALAGISWLVNNSIDIAIVENFGKREVTAVTIGNHPLVGVRKWRPEKVGEMMSSTGGIIDIVTEAYERPSGWLSDTFYSEVRNQQNQTWLIYLRNIATHWRDRHGAKVVEWERVLNGAFGTNNPFRSELPAELQNSKITYR
jgi:RHS repeat-associated protein